MQLKDDPELLHVDAALKRLGVSRITLHRLLKKYDSQLVRKLGKGKKGGRQGKSKGNGPMRRCLRSYVTVAFVRAVEEAWAGSPDRLSLADAAALLGVSKDAIVKLIAREVLKPLPPLPSDDGRATYLSRATVEALSRRRDEAENAALAPGDWKSLKALSERHRINLYTLGELLRVWVKDGKLAPPRISQRREANARRSRSRVPLYDAEAVAHLLRQRRSGVSRKDVVPPASARATGGEAATPHGRKRKGRRPGALGKKATERRKRILAAFDSGEYESDGEIADALGVDRTTVNKVRKAAGRDWNTCGK